ncbi:type II toxin-antitoxin system antitoxin DNA ADP-ribosyl glycohydrolase DarG [Chondromyces crocatus]|uniref:Appr-1-p processing protein n=1 Tax=Chondromyces crocatus TaxID=52 RepID=A0A0K1EAY8_CHOCO|nr:macro domain-containing protein [Chondromyces crocatus]AKT38046.1 Appr-1-p processing protein [Chondromyces crocatus]
MIESARGNLLAASADALVNTVNCVGVMGKGIALQFKQAFPDNFAVYARACAARELRPGRMLVVPAVGATRTKFIVNFPTKDHWKGKSKIADIRAGLEALVEDVRRLGIRSIAMPPLGCGNGGLEWAEVRPLIEKAFDELPDVRVILFEPQAPPALDAKRRDTMRPAMTHEIALLLAAIDKYLDLIDVGTSPELVELVLQKLAYFVQEGGPPLGLHFVKHRYGPYAHELRDTLRRLDGCFIHGLGEGTQSSNLSLDEAGAREAWQIIERDVNATAAVARVQRLIEGLHDPYGLELLATVHWVVTREGSRDADEAVAAVQGWSEHHRARFSEAHLRVVWQRLGDAGWFEAATPANRAAKAIAGDRDGRPRSSGRARSPAVAFASAAVVTKRS